MLLSYKALRTFTQKLIWIYTHFPEIFLKMYMDIVHTWNTGIENSQNFIKIVLSPAF